VFLKFECAILSRKTIPYTHLLVPKKCKIDFKSLINKSPENKTTSSDSEDLGVPETIFLWKPSTSCGASGQDSTKKADIIRLILYRDLP